MRNIALFFVVILIVFFKWLFDFGGKQKDLHFNFAHYNLPGEIKDTNSTKEIKEIKDFQEFDPSSRVYIRIDREFSLKERYIPGGNEIIFQLPDRFFKERRFIKCIYEVYGVEAASVCKTLNDEHTWGGRILYRTQSWNKVEEYIPWYVLQKGLNIIRFNLPVDMDLECKIRILSMEEVNENNRDIIIHSNVIQAGDSLYVTGFFAPDHKNLKINDIPVNDFGVINLVIPVRQKMDYLLISSDNGDLKLFIDPIQVGRGYTWTNEEKHQWIFEVKMLNNSLLEAGRMILKVDSGVAEKDFQMRIQNISRYDLPNLPPYIVNITPFGRGYRCLPHGIHFKRPIEVRIPFDKNLIPVGFGKEDIFTFYYDVMAQKWVPLEKVDIDTVNGYVVSLTDHFTDFINGVLKVPELPKTSGFAPNYLKDLAKADPMQGMTLISPAEPNHEGDLSLSFPFTFPPGRGGMQPQLALNYSSGLGEGLAGVGWNLSLPRITVETRWGVPMFLPNEESESYLLNGEQLVELQINEDTVRLPLVQFATRPRNGSNTTFFQLRKEGAFYKIIRHGNHTNNYWWEVIDKSGVRYLYGKYLNDASVNPNCVLRHPQTGNISEWLLSQVIDVHGNYVKYVYQPYTVTSGLYAGAVELLPSFITYTGFGSQDGPYRINFSYTPRSNYTAHANYGFLVASSHLLSDVTITFNNQFIKSYHLSYQPHYSGKYLLRLVGEIYDQNFPLDSLICPKGEGDHFAHQNGAYVHCFDYYLNDLISFENTSRQITTLSEDTIHFFGIPLCSYALDKSFNKGGIIGGGVGFGLGANVGSKKNSLTLNLNYSYSAGNDKILWMDLNGDGVVDRIRKRGVRIYFAKGNLSSSGQVVLSSEVLLSGLEKLGFNFSQTFDVGGDLCLSSFSAAASTSFTKTKTSRYFTDLNGDGFPDFVHHGDVYLNFPDENGIPHFSLFEGTSLTIPYDTCYRFRWEGGIDSSLLIDELDTSLLIKRDPVITYVIRGFKTKKLSMGWDIQRKLTGTTSDAKPIRYSVQHNNTILYTDSISAFDTILRTQQLELWGSFQKGDLVFFRLHGVPDHGRDMVTWTPWIIDSIWTDIPPTSLPLVDANQKPLYHFQYDADAVHMQKNSFTMPTGGTVLIKGYVKAPAQSDTLRLQLWQGNTMLPLGTYPDAVPFDHEFSFIRQVAKDDNLSFWLTSKTNVNWEEIDYQIKVMYLSADSLVIDTANPYKSIVFYPALNMTMHPHHWVPSYPVVLEPGQYLVRAIIPCSSLIQFNPLVTFSVKRKRDMILEKTYYLQDVSPQGVVFHLNVPARDTFYFDFHSHDLKYRNETFYQVCANDQHYPYVRVRRLGFSPIFSPTVLGLEVQDTSQWMQNLPPGGGNGNPSGIGNKPIPSPQPRPIVTYPAGFYIEYPDSMQILGNLYRGWGQFSYDPAIEPIELNHITISMDTNFNYYQTLLQSLDTNSTPDEITNVIQQIPAFSGILPPFLSMRANAVKKQWEDPYQGAVVAQKQLHSGYYMNMVASQMQQILDVYGDTIFDMDLILKDNQTPSGQPPKAVLKKAKDQSLSFSLGGSFNPTISGNISVNWTWSKSIQDFFDMNGDHLPDVITNDAIQYSSPRGGLLQVIPYNQFFVNQSTNRSVSVSLKTRLTTGLSLPLKSQSDHSRKAYFHSSSSFSVSGGKMDSYISYIDINGDGLPDKVNLRNDSISFNLGYGFTDWRTLLLTANSYLSNFMFSPSFSPSYEFEVANYSWSSGESSGFNITLTYTLLLDVNSDGLIDLIKYNPYYYRIYLNRGNGFDSSYQLQLPSSGFVSSLSGSINCHKSFTLGVSLPFGKFIFPVYGQLQGSSSSTYSKLYDINGDGAVDYLYVDGSETKVFYGIPQKNLLLKTVYTPAGSRYAYDYDRISSTTDFPQSKWVMSEQVIYDGFAQDEGDDYLVFGYSYENPKYHRLERAFYGFEKVSTYQYADLAMTTLYRKTDEFYHNHHWLFAGLKRQEETRDGNGNKYGRVDYLWKCKSVWTGEIIEDCKGCGEDVYAALHEQKTVSFDLSTGDSLVTMEKFEHGPYGNVHIYHKYGDIYRTDDDVMVEMFYQYLDSMYIMDRVSEVMVKDHAGQWLRHRKGEYDSVGNLRKIFIFDGNMWSDYCYEYDNYGNVVRVDEPMDVTGYRRYYVFTYEPVLARDIVKIQDDQGDVVRKWYDVGRGWLLRERDVAGNEVEYDYYLDGKVRTILGPYERDSGLNYTMKFEYWSEGTFTNGEAMLWGRVWHYDGLNGGNHFVTEVWVDGLGREIEKRRNAEVWGQDSLVVEGRSVYDALGRAKKKYHPFTMSITSIGSLPVNVPAGIPSETYDYDVLGRITAVYYPDNTMEKYVYLIGTDAMGQKCQVTRRFDQNGVVTEQYVDANGLTTMEVDGMGGKVKRQFSPLGELLESEDPDEHKTTFMYDLLGRKVQRNHPDAGITTWIYDVAGNLIAVQSSKLAGDSIRYEYEQGRLRHVRYPWNPELDVHYEYGDSLSGNNRSRLVGVESGSGVVRFWYGKLGEVIRQDQEIVVPADRAYAFRMRFKYDSYGRLYEVMYPDGEIVKYEYNRGGEVKRMRGKKGQQQAEYVNQILYDRYGRRVMMIQGNGVKTMYEYDLLNGRLKQLRTENNAGDVFQDIRYDYDQVGNILKMTHTGSVVSGGIGGSYLYTFKYDNRYRLIEDEESFSGVVNVNYRNKYSYHGDGRMMEWHADGKRWLDGEMVGVKKDWTYSYFAGVGPHRVSEITGSEHMNFMWNEVGELVSVEGDEWRMRACWDEEGRMMGIRSEREGKAVGLYMYDGGWQRVVKVVGGEMEVKKDGMKMWKGSMMVSELYVGQWLVGEVDRYWKRYVVGDELVAMSVGGGFGDTLRPVELSVPYVEGDRQQKEEGTRAYLKKVLQCVGAGSSADVEPMKSMHMVDGGRAEERFFFHGNHLSSVMWVSDVMGVAWQHLQYEPYGGGWVDERTKEARSSGFSSRYRFTGKEWDAESSLDYFGARYYWSGGGLWLSVDPLADRYPFLSPYVYGACSPVVLVDADGRFPILSGVVGFVSGLLAREIKFQGAYENRLSYAIHRGMEREINAWKIMYGLFKTDEEKSFLGRTWQVVSRFTWEGGQTIMGLALSEFFNMFGNVRSVDYVYGATVTDIIIFGRFAIGPYINFADYKLHEFFESNSDLRHEYGHYIQSQKIGPLYALIMLFSPLSAFLSYVHYWKTGNWEEAKYMHKMRWYERWATHEGERYFRKRVIEVKKEN